MKSKRKMVSGILIACVSSAIYLGVSTNALAGVVTPPPKPNPDVKVNVISENVSKELKRSGPAHHHQKEGKGYKTKNSEITHQPHNPKNDR